MGDKTFTAPATEISPIQWDIIIDRIGEGNCVPFLGAAVNVRSRDESYPYAGLPLADKVAFALVQQLMGFKDKELKELVEIKSHASFAEPGREDFLKLTLHNLARVALHVELETNFDFRYLLKRLQELLSGETAPSKLLETIARVNTLKLIVTTNYDRLMENALEKLHRPYERYVQPIDGFKGSVQNEVSRNAIDDARQAKLILYKIHGTFPDAPAAVGNEPPTTHAGQGAEGGGEADEAPPQPSRIIITEDDYIKFLTVIWKGEGMPNVVKYHMAGSTLLFLGYSLEDWDFRTIYKGLVETLPLTSRPTSYAIQKDPPRFWVEYWKRKGVTIFDVDVYRFADELKQRCQEKGLYREEWGADAGGD